MILFSYPMSALWLRETLAESLRQSLRHMNTSAMSGTARPVAAVKVV